MDPELAVRVVPAVIGLGLSLLAKAGGWHEGGRAAEEVRSGTCDCDADLKFPDRWWRRSPELPPVFLPSPSSGVDFP